MNNEPRVVNKSGLEEVLAKNPKAFRIKINSEDNLSKAKEAIDYNPNHEVYFKLQEKPYYYHGKLKEILGVQRENFAVQLAGSDRPSGFPYKKLVDLIIIEKG